MKKYLLLAMLLVPWACAIPPEPVPEFQPAFESPDFTEPGWASSRPALLVSDCQLHNLYSLPIPERNLSIKMFLGTAIRPPQLDLFAGDVLRWILQHGAGDTEVVIHLGDALDMACEGELRAFLNVMNSGGKPWLLVPGNHDCYHLGSYDPRERETWNNACYGWGDPITKDRLIRLYVAALIGQDEPGMRALAAALGLDDERESDPFELEERIPDRFSWRAPDEMDAFLHAIEWNIDLEKPWRSFIIQLADLSGRGPDGAPVFAVLMDSCQYDELPALIFNAWDNFPAELNCGMTGEILADQFRLVHRLLELYPEHSKILMCHHPLDSIASKSRSCIRWLWHHMEARFLVTAHTHAGHFTHHSIKKDRESLELNVGSTTDWPMEWRNFVVHIGMDQDKKSHYVKSDYFTLLDALKNRKGYFLPEWEVPLGANDDYRKYNIGYPSSYTFVDFYLTYHLWPPLLGNPRANVSSAARHTETQVKDTLLWTYHRLISEFPTDEGDPGTVWPQECRSDEEVTALLECTAAAGIPIEEKIALLMEMERFEKSRLTRDPGTGAPTNDERLRFKLCQAVWASRFELTRGRKLSPTDTLIRIAR